jgi:hypothetical protein
MLDRQQFIQVISKISQGETVTDDEFINVINLMKQQGMALHLFQPDPELSQRDNVFEAIEQKTLAYYESYLGQY